MQNERSKSNFAKKSYSAGSSRPGSARPGSSRPGFGRSGSGRREDSRDSRDSRNSRGGSSFFIQSGTRRGGSSRRTRHEEKIDISKFTQKSSEMAPETFEITHKFSDFQLCNEIQRNLKKKNYVTPTPIQDQSIDHIIDGKDLIGLANTGTGKTAAFLLPLINKVYNDRSQKVLILAPTRELAIQIDNEFREFSWDMKIFSTVCVGGAPIFKQINNLKRRPNFVIGTPGRLKDLSERGQIKFDTFNNIVIDEIDRMLDMGFVDEIKNILANLPEERQSLFFSATMPMKIREITYKFLKDPVKIEIKQGDTSRNVDQDIVRVRDRAFKFNQLQEILAEPDSKKVLIFNETKMDVERLTENLIKEGFKADSIHGDKKQHQRQRSLQKFKNAEINILVATDVAARGLDIKDVSLVINYTVPQTYDDYVHRIGRTGRAGNKGKALTFVDARF